MGVFRNLRKIVLFQIKLKILNLMNKELLYLSSISVALFVGLFLFMGNTEDMINEKEKAENVLGTDLKTCCTDPMTGFYRDGKCNTGPSDYGTHVVCAEMTQAFLEFTKSKGNDLSTPIPEYNFPGLKPGDKWCLCALRWREAQQAGKAPKVVLESTHKKALEYVRMEDLEANQVSSED